MLLAKALLRPAPVVVRNANAPLPVRGDLKEAQPDGKLQRGRHEEDERRNGHDHVRTVKHHRKPTTKVRAGSNGGEIKHRAS